MTEHTNIQRLPMKRRAFLARSSVALVGTAISSPVSSVRNEARRSEEFADIQNDRMRQLIAAALDSARSAGAAYADARLTFNQSTGPSSSLSRSDSLGFGVRALVDGYWGFAASPLWELNEAARLGAVAVENAKANIHGRKRVMDMAPVKASSGGEWTMPIEIDPFEIALEEAADFLGGLASYIRSKSKANNARWQVGPVLIGASFRRQKKAFGNTEGLVCIQKTYATSGTVVLEVRDANDTSNTIAASIEKLNAAGMGFEYLRDQPLRDYVDELYEELVEELMLPQIPVDVGRYPVLLHPGMFGPCISNGIGFATEIDRAMGFEANSAGTSYIVEPEEMLGNFQVASPVLNVTASKSTPGGMSTVRWDDEGVEPRNVQIVQNGVLSDMQTNREGAGWIKSYYGRKQMDFASSGCAYAYDAIDHPLIFCGDLTVQPSDSPADSVADLRKNLGDGIEWRRGNTRFDWQLNSGMATGTAFKLHQGKRVARLQYPGMLFRTPELLKNITRLGNAGTTLKMSKGENKGEPMQRAGHHVYAPAVTVKDMTIIDITVRN